jgi:hypothetical protein
MLAGQNFLLRNFKGDSQNFPHEDYTRPRALICFIPEYCRDELKEIELKPYL